MSINVDSIDRLVYYSPGTGNVLDLAGSHLQGVGDYFQKQEEYFQAGSGARYVKSQVHQFQPVIYDDERAEQVIELARLSDSVRAVALSESISLLWYESTTLAFTPQRGGPATVAGLRGALYTDKVFAHVHHERNLLRALAWGWGETDEERDANGNPTGRKILHQPGNTAAPYWVFDANRNITFSNGKVSLSGGSGTLLAELELPVPGAQLSFTGPQEAASITVYAISYARAVLQTWTPTPGTPTTLTLPALTWALLFQITATSASLTLPLLTVTDPGSPSWTFPGAFNQPSATTLLVDTILPCTAPGNTGDTGEGGNASADVNDGDTDTSTSWTCPDAAIVALSDTTPAPALEDGGATETLADEGDGLEKFTKRIVSTWGAEFWVDTITFEDSGGDEASPAAAFRYVVCAFECNTQTGQSRLDIDFEVAVGYISSGTYTVRIDVSDGFNTTELTFDMTKA